MKKFYIVSAYIGSTTFYAQTEKLLDDGKKQFLYRRNIHEYMQLKILGRTFKRKSLILTDNPKKFQ
jgi:hypothetical protein